MKFDPPLVSGTLVQRYKRFLFDAILDDGTAITGSCPNTGSMRGLTAPGSRVWTASIPSERRCSTNRRACVVLPAPSPPSNVMNLPRCTRAQWRARRVRQALTA